MKIKNNNNICKEKKPLKNNNILKRLKEKMKEKKS